MSSNQPPEKDLCRQAIEFLKRNDTGTLSTFSVKHEGFPYASVASYSLGKNGEPIFFFSSMATHSKNLRANPRAALLVAESSEGESGNLAAGRITLIGTVVPFENAELGLEETRTRYLHAHPEAKQWMSFGDFRFYRLELIEIYFVAGFAAMGWVSPEQFASHGAE